MTTFALNNKVGEGGKFAKCIGCLRVLRVNPNYNGSCNMILTSYQRLNTTGNLHFRLGGHYNSVFARDILKEVQDFFGGYPKLFENVELNKLPKTPNTSYT